MFKCDNCGEEYETRECFALSKVDGEDFMVFDGKRMRDTCPKCGGMIYATDEICLLKDMEHRKIRQMVA